jgi:hypothetical protein
MNVKRTDNKGSFANHIIFNPSLWGRGQLLKLQLLKLHRILHRLADIQIFKKCPIITSKIVLSCVEKIQSKSEKYNFLNSKFCIILISLSLLPSRYLEGLIAADNSVLDQFSNFVTFRLKPSHCTQALTRHKYVNYSCCCLTFCIFTQLLNFANCMNVFYNYLIHLTHYEEIFSFLAKKCHFVTKFSGPLGIITNLQ